MRINKFVALASSLSRRKADELILRGEVTVNGKPTSQGQDVTDTDIVKLGGRVLTRPSTVTIMLNKPTGYVVSREGQGSRTIYELLPPQYHQLQPVGRLDKDSSGLLLLTNDGGLAQELTHPSHQKQKIYLVTLYKPLMPLHRQMISDYGIKLEDGISKFELERLVEGDDSSWRITMAEGRNRQIRRTFAALNYEVKTLHRTHFGPYALGDLGTKKYVEIN
jgi:23S rRNA pseudouridine2605 synthase